MLYKLVVKKILFLLKPEKAHHLTLFSFGLLLKIPGAKYLLEKRFNKPTPNLQQTFWGITFPNPIGLAAGFDKDGRHFEKLAHLGFGFIEIGTVTPLPQNGNPRPRLFRLPNDEALINRMGFNNDGVDALVNRLKKNRPQNLIIGGNIGKNKQTPNELAHRDYFTCFDKLFPYVDYFVVNVSSPNTPDLRNLQEKEPLLHLLGELQKKNQRHSNPRPILLKIAPDLSDTQLDDIIEIVQATNIAGIIATNTTIARNHLKTPAKRINTIGSGGLSGQPLKSRSTEVIRYLRTHSTNPDLVIVGVGGIAFGEDALEKLDAGSNLVQVYSGLVYEGPSLIAGIKSFLQRKKVK